MASAKGIDDFPQPKSREAPQFKGKRKEWDNFIAKYNELAKECNMLPTRSRQDQRQGHFHQYLSKSIREVVKGMDTYHTKAFEWRKFEVKFKTLYNIPDEEESQDSMGSQTASEQGTWRLYKPYQVVQEPQEPRYIAQQWQRNGPPTALSSPPSSPPSSSVGSRHTTVQSIAESDSSLTSPSFKVLPNPAAKAPVPEVIRIKLVHLIATTLAVFTIIHFVGLVNIVQIVATIVGSIIVLNFAHKQVVKPALAEGNIKHSEPAEQVKATAKRHAEEIQKWEHQQELINAAVRQAQQEEQEATRRWEEAMAERAKQVEILRRQRNKVIALEDQKVKEEALLAKQERDDIRKRAEEREKEELREQVNIANRKYQEEKARTRAADNVIQELQLQNEDLRTNLQELRRDIWRKQVRIPQAKEEEVMKGLVTEPELSCLNTPASPISPLSTPEQSQYEPSIRSSASSVFEIELSTRPQDPVQEKGHLYRSEENISTQLSQKAEETELPESGESEESSAEEEDKQEIKEGPEAEHQEDKVPDTMAPASQTTQQVKTSRHIIWEMQKTEESQTEPSITMPADRSEEEYDADGSETEGSGVEEDRPTRKGEG
jgi:hypothetical protein